MPSSEQYAAVFSQKQQYKEINFRATPREPIE